VEALVAQLVVLIVFGCIASAIASSKGRSTVGWFFAGFFLHLIGIVIVAVLPNLKEQKFKEEAMERENRRLREQLMQEQIKTEAFRRHASARLDAHDSQLGIDTRAAASALPGANPQLALPSVSEDEELRLAPEGWSGEAAQNGAAQSLPVAANNAASPFAAPLPSSHPQLAATMAAGPAAAAAPAADQAASPAREWYYESQGKTCGPVSDKQLVALARQRAITTATLIWTESLQDWKPAGSVRPLQPYLQS
jgi:hypothetical protein